MVKKRKKLSGQGDEKFFSNDNSSKNGEEKITVESRLEYESSPIPEKIHVKFDDFIEKVTKLKELIEQFKTLVSDEEFHKLKARDLTKYRIK